MNVIAIVLGIIILIGVFFFIKYSLEVNRTLNEYAEQDKSEQNETN